MMEEETLPPSLDDVERRVKKIGDLLIEQYDNDRSKKVLLFMFSAYREVLRDRQHYIGLHGSGRTFTIAWADGYLTCASHLIDHYLQRRFKITGCSEQVCQLVVELKRLGRVFQDSPPPEPSAAPHEFESDKPDRAPASNDGQ